MKNLLLVPLFLFVVNIGMSQNTNPKKFEVGINLYNMSSSQLGISHDFFTGVMLKRNWENSALRFGVDYYYDSSKDDVSIMQEDWVSESSTLRLEGRIGYEYQILTHNKIRPYVGMDFITEVSFIHSSFQPEGPAYQAPTPHDEKTRPVRLGLAPTIGMRYQISSRFSANIETSLNIMTNVGNNVSNRTEAEFKPIRLLSVNYHF